MDIHILENLIHKIDIHKINYDIIKKNVDYLYKLFINIKKNYSHTFYKIRNEKKCDDIINILQNSFLSNYVILEKYLYNINSVSKIVDKNIYFYYTRINNNDDNDKIISLFNKAKALIKYAGKYDTDNKIVIIWFPIDIKRDFIYDVINNVTLKESENEYKAFTVSGVTYTQNNTRYTIITRYEEIDKLLLHELIHNLYLDYSYDTSCVKEYRTIKKNLNMYDYEYSMYESYTEIMASYYSIIFRNIDLEEEIKIKARLETEIFCELLYSYNTVANLIRINNYKSYDDFINNKKFLGNICVYEYYYVKALLYNNYILIDNKDKIYKNIIKVMSHDDALLKDIYDNMVKQYNYRYNFYC